jgi:hypothetical protein
MKPDDRLPLGYSTFVILPKELADCRSMQEVMDNIKALKDAIENQFNAAVRQWIAFEATHGESWRRLEADLKSGRSCSNLIIRTVEAAIEAGSSIIIETAQIERRKVEFESVMEEIIAGETLFTIQKGKLIQAIEAAFYIGVAGGECEIVPELLSEYNDARTRPARNARRAVSVQTMIDNAAQKFWAKYPDKRDRPSHTARAVWKVLKAKIPDMGGIPSKWQPDAWGDEKQMEDRVRQRLRHLDNRQSSKKKSG